MNANRPADVPVNRLFAVVAGIIFALLILFAVMRAHEATYGAPLPGTERWGTPAGHSCVTVLQEGTPSHPELAGATQSCS
jgi:hypothetical protein